MQGLLKPSGTRVLPGLLLMVACNGGTGGETGAVGGANLAGYAMPSCGPADGPAVEVYLATDPPRPVDPTAWLDSVARISVALPDTSGMADASLTGDATVRLLVWRGADQLTGQRFELAPDATWGSVSVCRAGTGCLPIDAGWLEFGPRDGEALTGRFELEIGAGDQAGEFRAEWVERTILCG